MLAIIRALEEWRPELEGLQRVFDIYTDHRALEYFMTTTRLSSRQVNWAEFLSRFHFTIQWRLGKLNVLADALTRQTNIAAAQNEIKEQYWLQTLLPRSWLDP